MLRNKAYAIYRGIECEIGYTTEDGYYVLFRKESVDKNLELELKSDGFKLTEGGNFFKPHITQSEVTEVYDIDTYAIYQGRRFSVENIINNGKDYVLSYIDNKKEDEEYLISAGFDRWDDRMISYGKTVPKEEIEKLYEEKTHIRYFHSKDPIGGNGSIESIVLYDRTVE